MVPLSDLASFDTRSSPEFTMRYYEYRSAHINATATPGYSADQARAGAGRKDLCCERAPLNGSFALLSRTCKPGQSSQHAEVASVSEQGSA
jgi:multidrug efflux pump subunit AcrB